MKNEYSVTEVRKFFAEITWRVHWEGDRVKIFSRNEFVLAIVPPQDLQRLWLNVDRRLQVKEGIITINSVREARQKFANLLNEVRRHKKVVEIYKHGGDLCIILIPPADFERLPK